MALQLLLNMVSFALVLAMGLSQSRTYHEPCFLLAILILPALSSLAWKKWRWGLSLLSLVFWWVGYGLFVNYMDNHWFSDPNQDCDGPCNGWYTFEAPAIYLPMFLSGIVSWLVGAGIALGKRMWGPR